MHDDCVMLGAFECELDFRRRAGFKFGEKIGLDAVGRRRGLDDHGALCYRRRLWHRDSSAVTTRARFCSRRASAPDHSRPRDTRLEAARLAEEAAWLRPRTLAVRSEARPLIAEFDPPRLGVGLLQIDLTFSLRVDVRHRN